MFFGNDKVFKNGKGHEMEGFLTEEEQKAIKKNLKNYKVMQKKIISHL